MRVVQIRREKTDKEVIFSADWIFPRPTGSRKERWKFYLRRLLQAVLDPRDFWRFGFSFRRTIFFAVPTQYADAARYEDAFFLTSLGVALYCEQDLFFEGVVDQELIDAIPELEKYFDYGHQRREITVTCQIGKREQQATTGRAQFFTLGVDSFHTLLCHEPRKKRALVFVDGFDIPLSRTPLLRTVHRGIAAVAQDTGNSSLLVRSNLREVSDRLIGWGQYHVTALAAVGLLLPFRHLMLSGESFNWPDWGLRFGVDSLFSTHQRSLELIAHNVPRDKTLQDLRQSPRFSLFLKHVRVCWQNVELPDLPYNCSNCQKCLRTRLTLLAYGVETAPTFFSIDISAVEKLELNIHIQKEWQTLYGLLKKRKGVDPALVRAVKKVIDKPLFQIPPAYRTYRIPLTTSPQV